MVSGGDLDSVFTDVAALPPERLIPFAAAQAPQAAAAVLLLFPPERAAEVLNGLGDDRRRRVLRAMMETRPMSDVARETAAGVLRDALLGAGGAQPDRARDVARIIDAMAPELREDALAALDAAVPALPPSATAAVPPAGPEISPLSAGLAAVVNAGCVIVERMPMLEVVMDRFVRILAYRLRDVLGWPVRVELEALRSVRFGDWMAKTSGGGRVFMVAHAAAWNHCALLVPDRAALDGCIEALTGGRGGNGGLRIADRPLTTLDRALAALPGHAAVESLGIAFEPVGDAGFLFDRLEEDAAYAGIDRPYNGALLAELVLEVDGRPGRLDVLLPYATLEPVRDRLRQTFMGERFGEDPLWRSHLRAELARVRTPVVAVAGTAELPLGSVLAWQPGTVVALAGDGHAVLEAGGVELARGALGRSGDRRAVMVGSGGGVQALPVAQASAFPAPVDPRHGIPVRVGVVLGRSELPLARPSAADSAGTVVLDRAAEDPVEVHANGRVVAYGELVRVGSRFGVRLLQMAGR